MVTMISIMLIVIAVAMTIGARANRIRQQNKNIYKQAKRHKYEKK